MSASASARELHAVPAADPAGASLRKAALLLHAMAEGDRAWILSQLTDGERESIGSLLAELKELGIPADRSLLEDALGREGPRPPATEGSAQGEAALDALRRAAPGRLAGVLRGEPAALIAGLLRISDWPWRKDLLRALETTLRRRVQAALEREPGPRSELYERHLIAAVARRLAGAPSPVRGPVAWLGRLGGRNR